MKIPSEGDKIKYFRWHEVLFVSLASPDETPDFIIARGPNKVNTPEIIRNGLYMTLGKAY